VGYCSKLPKQPPKIKDENALIGDRNKKKEGEKANKTLKFEDSKITQENNGIIASNNIIKITKHS
jgi:hypothetical protein